MSIKIIIVISREENLGKIYTYAKQIFPLIYSTMSQNKGYSDNYFLNFEIFSAFVEFY